jgi:hypothetical protein
VHKRKVAYVAHAIVPNIQRPAVVVREPHAAAILACDNPEAIVLDFVQPPVAGGQNLSVFVGRHGTMNPAGRVRCNMWTK